MLTSGNDRQTLARRCLYRLRAAAAALALGVFAATPLQAQDVAPPAPIDPFSATELTDYREEMRLFIQSISAYARTFNPGFVVIVKDGLELIGKPDPLDGEQLYPARAYARAIDGVMEDNLLDETTTTPDGKPDPFLEQKLKRRAEDLERARQTGLIVFDLEYATDAQAVEIAYEQASAKGYVPFVAERPRLDTVPAHPRAAFKANPKSLSNVRDVQNFLYLASSQNYGDTTEYIQALRDTNHDMIIVDVFSGHVPLTRQQVEFLKYKKLGARRLVLAQIDIASAAAFHYYWQPGWRQGNPPFIFTPYREDPDRHRVIYWDPGWQAIISGNPNSYVYGVIDLGFDGVVLTGVDVWSYFESGGEQP